MSSRLEERKREITLLGLDPEEYDFGDESPVIGSETTDKMQLFVSIIGVGILGWMAMKMQR